MQQAQKMESGAILRVAKWVETELDLRQIGPQEEIHVSARAQMCHRLIPFRPYNSSRVPFGSIYHSVDAFALMCHPHFLFDAVGHCY
jgi:hypothetical protein